MRFSLSGHDTAAAPRFACHFVLLAMCWLSAAAANAAQPLRGVALVIGNGEYRHLTALPNPANDARAVESLYSKLGFTTTLVSDRDARKLGRDLDLFAEDAEGADVAMVYYSGHGIEAGGENYLVPVDADPSALDAAGERLVPVSAFIERLQETVPVVIVMLDACRTNPFPEGSSVRLDASSAPALIAKGGLGQVRGAAPSEQSTPGTESYGTVLAFAAEPGKVALDGKPGGNSPYAAAILRHLSAMSGQEFGAVMRMVAEEVYLKTAGRQRPWVNESLRRLLYFGRAADPLEGDEGQLLAERRELLITIAAFPDPEQSRRQVEDIAAQGGVPLDAVYGILRAMGAEAPQDPAELGKVLRAEAERFAKALAERQIINSPDPEIVRLSALADQAERDGLLTSADRFRERAKARFLQLEPTLAAQQAALDQRYIEGASVFERSAATKELVMDYEAAAKDYGEAFRLVDHRDGPLALRYKLKEMNARSLDMILRPFDAEISRDIVAATGETVELARRFGDQRSLVESLNLHGQTMETLSRQEADAGKIRESKAIFEKAVAAYRSALETITPQSAPDLWLQTQTNLATAFYDSAGRFEGRVASLRQAAAVYREARNALPPTNSHWSKLQMGLAAILREHARYDGDPIMFEEAAGVYRAILRQPATDSVEVRWRADARRELSAALIELSRQRSDRAPLDEAVELHRATRAELSPGSSDAIVNEELLGAALEERAKLLGDVAEAVRDREAAIEAYRMAAENYSYEFSSLGWAQRQAALGDALYALGSRESGTERLGEAVAAYRAALAEYTRERVPHGWALYQVSLGNALLALGLNENLTKRLEEAAAAYRSALQEQTGERAPLDRATTQSNLGFTLTIIGENEGDLTRLEEAESILREALAAQQELMSPDSHYTESDLCRAMLDIGESKGDRANLLEAKALCEAALVGLKPFDEAAADEAAENYQQVEEALAKLE